MPTLKNYNKYILILALLPLQTVFGAKSGTGKEYEIKAAFLYNFAIFTEWKEQQPDSNEPNIADPNSVHVKESNEPIVFGVIGKDPFGNAFEPILRKTVKNRKVKLKRFKGFAHLKKTGSEEVMNQCDLLFVCKSEKEYTKDILAVLKDSCVLTVSETPGFLESGGMIRFMLDGKRVAFEINTVAAERVGIKFRSKLLKLAKRVILPDESKKEGQRP